MNNESALSFTFVKEDKLLPGKLKRKLFKIKHTYVKNILIVI